MIPILILAAGGSTRMRGTDKLLEPVGGVPLLRVQAKRALATGQPVFVALPAADHPRTAALDGLGVTVLPIPAAAEGMSGTLRDAVAVLPAAPAFMLVLADLVAITTIDLLTVLAAWRDDSAHLIWRGATTDGKPGHPIIFAGSLRPEFAKLKGDTGGASIVRANAHKTHLVALPANHARQDLDTPEDWAKWRGTNG
ncbi:nucleotidyltransferase family protein [Yoonia sp.]|uniref:nucleotidyltransferase family protein n=1 Tax=Yoonia sp. TaxID=2212373 RepID=UPI001A0B6F4E|nr:nucleotidyltransferase family protein [Yoonia sp.]MBE0413858.1 nucleotidyltransferase family protein [Yoonia sp.]